MKRKNQASLTARIICRLIGHNWRTVWDGGPKAHGWPSLTCIRCHESAWRAS